VRGDAVVRLSLERNRVRADSCAQGAGLFPCDRMAIVDGSPGNFSFRSTATPLRATIELAMQAPDSANPPLRWRFWLLRTLAALAFAFAASALVEAGWIGLLVAAYGGFDTALKDLRTTTITAGGSAAFFASAIAAFMGAFIAPLVLGRCTQRRRTVVLSSVVGAVLATLPALTGSLSWVVAPGTMMFAWIGLALGVVAGICGGAMAGWMMKRAEKGVAADRTRD
jgi:hypothetical protein